MTNSFMYADQGTWSTCIEIAPFRFGADQGTWSTCIAIAPFPLWRRSGYLEYLHCNSPFSALAQIRVSGVPALQ
ncbi:hypothetical protein [Amphritea balenae]|uniref:Uncharacterized protein n=1 Tax=Amphritea balenae TaxID=452629 RepID=A0A3P1SHD4_9GAMM|nr:hypothetical protein [Amphritea balenae]RRC96693.1 hypothetical protein EHS89_20720 [Amphritea balenae]